MSETCHHDVAHHKVCERCIDERDLGATPQPQGGKRMADADFEARAHRTDQRLNWLYDEARRARAEADALRADLLSSTQARAQDRLARQRAEAERDALRAEGKPKPKPQPPPEVERPNGPKQPQTENEVRLAGDLLVALKRAGKAEAERDELIQRLRDAAAERDELRVFVERVSRDYWDDAGRTITEAARLLVAIKEPKT